MTGGPFRTREPSDQLVNVAVVRICLVMGAGASYAHGLHFRPVRGQQRLPPLDYNFFPKIAELGLRVPADLSAYAATLPTGSPFEHGGRMEDFFRDVFHDFLEQADNATSPPVRAYRELVQIYAGVLRRTTDWMRGTSYSGGPVGRIIAAAADAARRVDIITFNHDLVIENEVFRRARLRARWCIERGYDSFGAGRTYLVTNGQPMFPTHSTDCDHEQPILIHKMHGSLNWYVRIRASEPTPGVLRGRVTGSAPDVLISTERGVREIRHVRMRPAGGRTRWYVWPVIVPPIYDKQALIQSFMPSVWNDARSALLNCDRLVFFGYSLPFADIGAEKLFQRAVASNPRLPWVGVVDPATSVVSRYADLMPDMPLRRFPTAQHFLDGESFD